GLAGEPSAVLVGPRALAEPPPPFDLDGEQLPDQGRAGRPVEPAEVVLDPRPLPRPPTRLEPVAGVVDAARPGRCLGVSPRGTAGADEGLLGADEKKLTSLIGDGGSWWLAHRCPQRRPRACPPRWTTHQDPPPSERPLLPVLEERHDHPLRPL